jgi:hypothetical protein
MTGDRPPLRVARAPAAFWMVTMGERMLFLARCDRFTEDQATAELGYFQGLFGPSVQLEKLELGEDMIVSEMAIAIHTISKDGTGVRPQHLEDLGFAPEHVARYFTRAHGIVSRSYAPVLVSAIGGNVVTFKPGRRR